MKKAHVFFIEACCWVCFIRICVWVYAAWTYAVIKARYVFWGCLVIALMSILARDFFGPSKLAAIVFILSLIGCIFTAERACPWYCQPQRSYFDPYNTKL